MAIGLVVVPALFVVRVITRSGNQVSSRNAVSRRVAAAAGLQLESSYRSAQRSWHVELVDSDTYQRLPVLNTSTAWGAKRVMLRASQLLEVPAPIVPEGMSLRSILLVVVPMALMTLITLGAFVYGAYFMPTTFQVVVWPWGEVKLDDVRLPLQERPRVRSGTEFTTTVPLKPGGHRVSFRRDPKSDWVQTSFSAADHTEYRLLVDFDSRKASVARIGGGWHQPVPFPPVSPVR